MWRRSRWSGEVLWCGGERGGGSAVGDGFHVGRVVSAGLGLSEGGGVMGMVWTTVCPQCAAEFAEIRLSISRVFELASDMKLKSEVRDLVVVCPNGHRYELVRRRSMPASFMVVVPDPPVRSGL